jgi:hypothetical protein
VYDNAKEDGYEKGFCIDDIHFTGFYSQGDGACWVGQVDIRQWLESHEKDSIGLSAWCQLIQEDFIDKHIKVTQSGHYSHENTMCFNDLDFNLDPDPSATHTNGYPMGRERSIFAGMEWKALLDIIQADVDCQYKNLEQIEQAITESAKDFARSIYSKLRNEYEYLCSEEHIAELCDANEYLFNEKGELL